MKYSTIPPGMILEARQAAHWTNTPRGRAAWMAAGAPDLFRGEPSSIPAATYAFYRRIGMWPRRQAPITAASYERQLRQLLDTGQVSRGLPFTTVWNPTFWQAAAAGRW